VTATDAADAFAILADETRLAIIEELVAAYRESPHQPELSFSALRDRTGIRDPGQFNYHLDKLVGRFVEKRDDGYELSYAGMRVAGAILSGYYDLEGESFQEDRLDPCPVCDSPLQASYTSGLFRLGCENEHAFADLVPPRIFEGRDLESVVEVVAIATIGGVRQAQRGSCPQCFGEVEWSMMESSDPSHDSPVGLLGQCRTCGTPYSAPPGTFATWDPTLQLELRTCGIDVWDAPAHRIIRGQEWPVDSYDLEVGRATVAIELEPCPMTATVNERGRVLELSTE
jgi:DNA-binding transcriptional ArsR family regulator